MKKPRYNAVKIESLDRGAVFISTSRKARAAGEGKGATAEVLGRCLLSGCWVGREHLPDCHKFFVKRYHWLFGKARWGRFSVYSMDRLTKRFIFLHFPAGGEQKRRTRRRQL